MMTRNQIFKSQLIETAQHNRAMEELSRGELAERSRSNRESERIGWENANIQRFRANKDFIISSGRLNLDRDRFNSESLINYNRMIKEHDDRQRSSELYKRELDLRERELGLNSRRAKSANWSSVGKMALQGLAIVAPYALGASGATKSAAQIAAQLFKY